MTDVPDDGVCDEVCTQLARLALGLEPDDPRLVTSHVRACRDCEAFVDELAGARGWLPSASEDPVPDPGDPEEFRQRVHWALGVELAARFARDLLAVVEGKAPREREARERDRARLELVLEDGRLAQEPWPEVFALIDAPPRALRARARALDLAAELDPVGLDIGLSHIATLVRVGDVERADAEADRWTRLVE